MTPSPRGSVVAVVPLRDGVSGKSRLAAVLDPASRRALVAVLARRVVATLAEVSAIDRIVVVTADPEFARTVLASPAAVPAGGRVPGPAHRESPGVTPGTQDPARHRVVEIVEQPADRPGLNAALDVAREHLLGAARPPARLLVAHADLPALAPDDVVALLAEDADVVVATDRVGQGTNLLLVPLADRAFAFRFGVGSRAAHETEGARHGLRTTTVRRPGTAVDLDTTDDWGELPAQVRAAVGQEVPGLP